MELNYLTITAGVLYLILLVISYRLLKLTGTLQEEYYSDILPGKRMAIDADINVDLIDDNIYNKRKTALKEENNRVDCTYILPKILTVTITIQIVIFTMVNIANYTLNENNIAVLIIVSTSCLLISAISLFIAWENTRYIQTLLANRNKNFDNFITIAYAIKKSISSSK